MSQRAFMEPSSLATLGRPVPIEEAGTAREVAERVRQGRSVLKIVSTPWGIEFFTCDVVGKR